MNGCPVAGLSVQGRRPFGLTVNGKAIPAAGCGLPDTGNNAALTRTAQPARYPSSTQNRSWSVRMAVAIICGPVGLTDFGPKA